MIVRRRLLNGQKKKAPMNGTEARPQLHDYDMTKNLWIIEEIFLGREASFWASGESLAWMVSAVKI